MTGCLPKLYIGKSAEGLERRVSACLRRGDDLPGLFFVTFASNGTDQLDIVPSWVLRQERARAQLPTVVGYAIGKEEVTDLVGQIARDAWLATGACHLRDYLLSLQPQGAE